MLAVLLVASSACSVLSPGTAPVPAKSAATQTPWIIYMPVTNTPEPFTVTPLPTVAVAGAAKTPTRTATKSAAVVATKPPAAATATKPAVAVVPSATAAPKCPVTGITLQPNDPIRFPGNAALRRTPGPDTFDFKWTPFQAGESDSHMGYDISINSKRAGFSNGAEVYLSHNWFLKNGQHYIFDQRAVSALASGESVAVTWYVKVVFAPSGFNESDPSYRPVGLVDCGSANPVWTIDLQWVGS